MTKRYKLLKDLPWCKAGVIYTLRSDNKLFAANLPYIHVVNINKFSEWFEEVKQPTINDIDWNFEPKPGDICHCVDNAGNILRWTRDADEEATEVALGNCFRTKQEAEVYAKWLKAVAELRRSSDFKPDWNNRSESKFYVVYNAKYKEFSVDFSNFWNHGTLVYYQTGQAAQNSIKNHEQAWLTYFGVEGGN